MPLPSETDVLIVGAGPSGLALAVCLARHGTNFVLVDRLTAPQANSRAAAVHARTLEVLEPLGVTDALVKAGRQIGAVCMHDRDALLLRIEFAALRSRYPYILVLPQNETEAILTDHLASLGGTVERGQEALALVQDGVHATAALRDATGAAASIKARYVVGADGYHSLVRQACGIGFAPGTYAESFILADVHMDFPLGAEEMRLFLASDGMMLVAPFTGSRFRIIATCEAAREHPDANDVQAILDNRGARTAPARVQDVIWSSRFRIHHGVAAQYRAGCALLAGDAAHVHSPAGGQGMNIGIQDAVALGERLAAVIGGHQPDSYLQRYEVERRPVAQRVVALTDRMTRMGTLTSPAGQLVRNLGLRAVGYLPPMRRMMATRMAELDSR
ncbi:MAG TPA: FAD-dependent monooxygenase [Rhodopila sp.]|nr:FAD-dependent monooxygenase [Rhodopila sp.]